MRKVVVNEGVTRIDTINVTIKSITTPIDIYSYTAGLTWKDNNISYIRNESVPFRKYDNSLQTLTDPE